MKFVDLFSGIGGTRLGLENACKKLNIDTECVFSSEIKGSAIRVYQENFNEDSNRDITQIDPHTVEDFEFLLAGFPCQSFSSAGKRLGFQDTRGTLFFEVCRFLDAKKPNNFLLENVDGLTTHDNGKTFDIIINSLMDIGYNVNYEIFNALDFGVPQNRKRIYIWGSLGTVGTVTTPMIANNLSTVLENGLSPEDTDFTRKVLAHYAVNDLIGKKFKDKRGGPNNITSWQIGYRGQVSQDECDLLNMFVLERRKKKWSIQRGVKWSDGQALTLQEIQTFHSNNTQELIYSLVQKGYLATKTTLHGLPGYDLKSGKLSFPYSKILDPLDYCETLVATDCHKLGTVDGNGIRHLTVKELKKIMGYEDGFSFDTASYSEACDLIGNSVCPPVIESIVHQILM